MIIPNTCLEASSSRGSSRVGKGKGKGKGGKRK